MCSAAPRRSSSRFRSRLSGSFASVPAQWEPELIDAQDDIQCLNDQVFLLSGRMVWQWEECVFTAWSHEGYHAAVGGEDPPDDARNQNIAV